MKTNFDVIVVGVGSMGSSACYFLSKMGSKVLGLDQFDAPHEFGSHTGQSRIIRKAYFEDPGYVPLLNSAYENWKNLEEETGAFIYQGTGLVYFGPSDSEMIKGVKRSARVYAVPLEELRSDDVKKRLSQFAMPANFEALFEQDAGFVCPEEAISLYKEQAIRLGADLHSNEKVITWRNEGSGIVVTTTKDQYYCDKLVLTAGAWAGKMIPGFVSTLRITRQFVAWIQPKSKTNFELNNFPCWMIADDQRPGAFYGFPVLPEKRFGPPSGLKLAYHYPGDITDPDDVNQAATSADLENILYALNKYLPQAGQDVVATKTCLYANTPDENFIIDKLPGFEDRVLIACGFSGHGFKFMSVVGEILADLALKGKTAQPIEFLNAKRFV
jgi:sarcosine oxidase